MAGDPFHPRQTSGLTTKLILTYVDRVVGPGGAEAVLERCGLAAHADHLRDESCWVSFATKIALFEAAADVVGDPVVTRSAGATALEMNVAGGLKVALRALGSPRMVYGNVVRANAKFSTDHRMQAVELDDDRAVIRYVDEEGTGFHPLDCEYNVGLLSCVPALFGQPPAHVRHLACAGAGDPACVYEVTWAERGNPMRGAVALAGSGTAGLLASLLAVPHLALPAAGVAIGAWALAAGRAARLQSRRLQSQTALAAEKEQVAEQLMSSLQDLVSELRPHDLFAKVVDATRTAFAGRELALLLQGPEGLTCRRSSGLGSASVNALERWASSTSAAAHRPLVVDRWDEQELLGPLGDDPSAPLHSLCSAPLVFRGECQGVLVALSAARYGFLESDAELLRSYANQAAIALANARMYVEQERLAARDALTGLLNHREFHVHLRRELARCERTGDPLTLVVVDLDRFKEVNDSAGHLEGDRVLRLAADALAGACRGSDVPFRIGGDEFAVLLADASLDAAERVAERIEAAIGAVDPRIGASCGAASFPGDGSDAAALIDRADQRLYAVKRRRHAGARRGDLVIAESEELQRLRVATELAATLAPLSDEGEIAQAAVDRMVDQFGFSLVAVVRADGDVLRLVRAAGEALADIPAWRRWQQPLSRGVSGRVARTGEPALVPDTRWDPDFVDNHIGRAPLSELCVPVRVNGAVWGVLDMESVHVAAFGQADQLLAETVAVHLGAAIERSLLFADLEDTFVRTLAVLCDALEAKDLYTAAHARDVADLCRAVGGRLGLDGSALRQLEYAALLHDIGKIGIPTDVLNKPGPLTPDERALMERHVVIGAEMLERVPGMHAVAPLVRHSHERWDGRGYPDGLAGERIPLAARIVSVCDALHAMTSDRPYRAALEEGVALRELENQRGAQFDPVVVDAVLAERAPLSGAGRTG